MKPRFYIYQRTGYLIPGWLRIRLWVGDDIDDLSLKLERLANWVRG